MFVMAQQEENEWPIAIRAGSVTVKVYRTPTRGNPGFTIAYHEGARRVRRMFADLGKARREAKLTAHRINAGQGEALKLTGNDRDSYLYAVGKLKPLAIGLVPAIDEYVEAKKWNVSLPAAAKNYHESHAAKLPVVEVERVFRELLAAKQRDGASDSYLHDLKIRLRRFAKDFRSPISEITTRELDDWLRRLNSAPRSRNNHRNAVVLLFNFAKASGYLDRERTTAAEHTSLARLKADAIQIFTPTEFARLLAASTDETLPFLALGGFCGIRTAEIQRLNWSDIRWRESSVVIRAGISKTRTRRLAPLTKPAKLWLARFQKHTGPLITGDVHLRIQAVAKASGVTWKSNVLRHSFITYRVAVLKDFVRTAYEAGNSPQIIRSNYDAVATQREGKSWFALTPSVVKQRLENHRG